MVEADFYSIIVECLPVDLVTLVGFLAGTVCNSFARGCFIPIAFICSKGICHADYMRDLND